MRTYSRESFLEAKRLWEEGEFGWQWQHYRRIAADRGFIYPPTGTKHDDADWDEPSQRAIIWRAIEDQPVELERIMRRSRSWWEVVDSISGMNQRLRIETDERDRDDGWERKERPSHREAVMSLGAILGRIEESR